MKSKLPLILIFVFFTQVITYTLSPSSKGESEYRLLYLHYQNATGEKGVTTFEYDKNNKPARALWQLLDGSRNSLNFYTYDHQGHLIKKYREFSDKKTSVQHFKYNAQGQLVYEDFSRSDGVEGEMNYSYNQEGKCISAKCHKLNGWFTGIIEYQYEKNTLRSGGILKRKDRVIGKITYDYNDHRKLHKEHWDFYKKWSQTFVYEYDFYSPGVSLPYTSSNVFLNINTGHQVIKENYDYSNKSGGPSQYIYQGDKLVKKVFTRSDGLKTLTHYFYDGKHRLVKSHRRYAHGKSGIFSYYYTPERQLIKRTFIRTDGAKSSEQYTYNKKGQLVKGIWKNFDAWLTGTIIFTHDAKGRLKNGYFKGEGKKKFNARILFTHDSFDNLSKIHWIFSFKGTQTYTFDYQEIKKKYNHQKF